MGKKHEPKEDLLTKITKRTEQFIVRYLKIIVFSVGAVFVIFAAYFTINLTLTRKATIAENAFGKVYLVYNRILNDTSLDSENREKQLINISEDFKFVLDEYPRSAAASRSAYYIGNILFRTEKYEEALQYYGKGSLIMKNNYSALLSLQGEASCFEQLEDYEEAEEVYKSIIEMYGDSFIIPTVRFNLGQLYEKQNKFDAAREEYNLIVSDYSWSSWSQLAQKRILLLKNT
jgi:tetratricopeptide (TPR) repeat protein